MSEKARLQILDAAARRFTYYGYSKTTIAEIAQDCEMSVGNIYRHFENKEAIAKAGVEQKMNEKAEVCEKASQSGTTAIDKIRQYLLARLRHTYQMSCNSAHMFELVELITNKYGELLKRFDERGISWLAQIIEQGVAQGEFRRQDARKAAGSIFVATMAFCIPIFMQEPLPLMEERLNDLIELFYQGLKA